MIRKYAAATACFKLSFEESGDEKPKAGQSAGECIFGPPTTRYSLTATEDFGLLNKIGKSHRT